MFFALGPCNQIVVHETDEPVAIGGHFNNTTQPGGHEMHSPSYTTSGDMTPDALNFNFVEWAAVFLKRLALPRSAADQMLDEGHRISAHPA